MTKEAKDTWEYIQEWKTKFGRYPKDADELASCIDFVIARKQNSLPEGLDEAARAYMPKPNGIESNTDFSFMQMVWMFEQGASWMAGQGDIVETEPYFCDEEGNAEVTAATTFKPGDKVFVQIRKAK